MAKNANITKTKVLQLRVTVECAPEPAGTPCPMPRLPRPSILTSAVLGLGLLLVLGFAMEEMLGWPWLVQPLQTQLSQRLQRPIQLGPPEAYAASGTGHRARLGFWGGLSLQTPWLEVAAPPWSQAPHLVTARDVDLRLRYIDLWHAWRGQPLVVHALHAGWLDAVLERQADGRTSWQGAPQTAPTAAPQVESMGVQIGNVRYTDAVRGLQVQGQGTLVDQRLVLQLTAKAGPAQLSFAGHADDTSHWDRVQGRIRLQGPSLAAMGTPLGVSLPTTAAFQAQGQLRHADGVWDVVVDSAQVGTSQLAGTFRYQSRRAVPRLSGTLTGQRLDLRDLGPAVGVEATPTQGRTKVLPSRPFNLEALRVMDADLAIAIRSLDLNTTLLEPLQPLNAHLRLAGGVLSLQDIDARTSQGRLGGTLSLNGQQDRAHWVADLQWRDVVLEHWLRLRRSAGQPPYVSGKLQGRARLEGTGRSTAEILASLQGQVVTMVSGGSMSHLLIEMGGLDIAQALGVMVQGDKALPLDCAVADLAVSQGTLRPRVLVLDTSDSTAWIDGTVSLATEAMDLRTIVAPKDISPLTLRTPLHVTGTFAAPQVSVEKGLLGTKLGSSLLLGLINPLAALLPLVDTGNNDEAKQHANTCQARLQEKLHRPGATS